MSVQLLCDFIYVKVTENMDSKEKTDFDAQLDECGSQPTDQTLERRVEASMSLGGEVEYV